MWVDNQIRRQRTLKARYGGLMKLSLKQMISIYGKVAGGVIWEEQNRDFLDGMVQIIERREYLEKHLPERADDDK